MNRQAIQTRYLLGKLSDAESASLEEQSFVDDDVFDELEIAEDELIDAYVDGSLSAEDRERFEKKLLKSERVAERVEFAKSLSNSRSSKVMVQEPAKRSWWPGWFDISFGANPALTSAAVTALFLIVLALPVFVWMRMRFESLNLERARLEQQRQQQERDLATQIARANASETERQSAIAEAERVQRELQETQELLAALEQRAPTNRQSTLLASITLNPGSSRNLGEGPLLSVSRTARTIQLRLVLDTEEDYDEYRARIRSAANDNVLTSGALKASRSGRSPILNFSFDAKKLPPGEYSVRVSGRTPSGTYEPVAAYSVRVVKK